MARVRYLPVVKDRQVIGYLWYAETGTATGYLRRLVAQDHIEGLRCAAVWQDRLQVALADGLTAPEAVRRWIGVAADADAGGVTADSERSAPDLAALGWLANPGYEEPPLPTTHELRWPDGPPMDRSRGWEDLSPFTLDQPGYAFHTRSAVRYLPVTRNGTVLGYLWASVNEDAADYQRRIPAGSDGYRAGALWIERLNQCHRDGLAPLTALRLWVGAPEHPDAGGIAADARERTTPGLDALKEIARG